MLWHFVLFSLVWCILCSNAAVFWNYRYALSFAGNYLKQLYVTRTPQVVKTLHVVSSALKAIITWHNMRTLQVAERKTCIDVSLGSLVFYCPNNILFRNVVKHVEDKVWRLKIVSACSKVNLTCNPLLRGTIMSLCNRYVRLVFLRIVT